MKTIRAKVQDDGRVALDFGYDEQLQELLKNVSGFWWDKPKRKWFGAYHSLAALQFAVGKEQLAIQIAVSWPLQASPVIIGGNLKLHEYQLWGAAQLLLRPDFILVWSPRVGKTSATIAAVATGIATKMFDRALVLAPAQVVPEWEAALEKQLPGMTRRELVRGLGAADMASSHFVFVQHDQVAVVRGELAALAKLGRFALVLDEPQRFQDYRAPRSKCVMDLAALPTCTRRMGLTGTPMRNTPDDLAVTFAVFGGLGKGQWNFLKRYAGAHEDETIINPHTQKPIWTTGEPTNLDELAHRLGSISHRLTREQVKPDLLPLHRTVRICEMSREDGQRYKALESALGRVALKGKGKQQLTALKTLAATALNVKVDAALERIAYHCGRGKKVLLAAHWHESLQATADALTKRGWPFHLAGGWLPPERRKRITTEWRDDPQPTPLLLNIVASGIGIDLSDADGSIILEVPWVPADALQFEPRIIDVHQGKRTTQPWVEYLLSRGTTDEDMALANLRKIATIDVVVGAERESTGLASALRDSGVVDTVDLGLINKSDDAVEAALAGLRARLAGLDDPAMSDPSGMSLAALAGAVAEAFEEEETDDAELADAGGS